MEETLDLSQTQRIVFFIDLHPLLHLQNPKPYVASVLGSARILLNFPSLSSSLFAFKFFFSSLSPLLSSSKLHRLLGKSASSFSFDRPSETLISLSETLNSFHGPLSEDLVASPRASHTASSLRQLVHDYAWEPQIEDVIGKSNGFSVVRSNLILLFSPVSRSLTSLSEFMNLETDNKSLVTVDAVCEKCFQIFGTVNEGFAGLDIHFSWVDVNYEQEYDGRRVERNEPMLGLGFIERGIKSLGWGFCSTDTIILGSALVPFGLIYPNIGCSLKGSIYNNCCNRGNAELSLEISDVIGRPLECKFCDLELLDLKPLSGLRSNDVLRVCELANSGNESCDQGKAFWGDVGEGITKIHVTEVRRNNDSINSRGCLSDFILLRALSSGDSGKDQMRETLSGSFADRILEMLRMETCEFELGKPTPIWQLLLTFLYREGYWALVSVSKRDGDSFMGILKPFTVHSALLSIFDRAFSPQDSVTDSGGSSRCPQFITKTDSGVHNDIADLNHPNVSIASQSGALSSKMSLTPEDGDKRKKNRKQLHLLQDFTWGSFYKAVLNHFEMDLEDVYFARKSNNSKKLRFLKCWMKQVRKFSLCHQNEPNQPKAHPDVQTEMEERLVGPQQESEQPISSSLSTGEALFTAASGMKEEAAPVSCLESSEAFFLSISQKIQHGLESTEVDLGALAERLVDSSIHWLYWKHEIDNEIPEEHPDSTYGGMVASDLVKLLLKKPKDLALKYKTQEPSSHPSNPSSAKYTSENIVREYELQILFRMEIFRSKVRASIEETMKKNMVKQICLLLEIIQYHLAGGFFGDVSLDAYVGKIIKNRYSQSLGDVVCRIYTRMDLLLFDDDGEASGLLLNSEDSDQPWRDIPDKNEIGVNATVGNDSTSVEGESSQLPENDTQSPGGTRVEEHVRQLVEAQERRERARRFASFTSWVPDLQRVWAPKQPKTVMAKPKSQWKLSKGKKRRGVRYDVVCETPMTGKKRSYIGDEGDSNNGINSCGSVSKALFQDEDNAGASTIA